MIYAVEIKEKRFVKIGYTDSTDAASRIAALQTGNPYEINKLFCVDGTLRQEQALHSALKVAFGRIRIPMPPNEWYPGKSEFFTNFLEYLSYGPDAGLLYLDKYSPNVKQCGKKGNNVEPNIRWPTD